jgi:hypothetical protein
MSLCVVPINTTDGTIKCADPAPNGPCQRSRLDTLHTPYQPTPLYPHPKCYLSVSPSEAAPSLLSRPCFMSSAIASTRVRKACLPCIRAKAKCSPSEHRPNECHRCKRLSKDCVFEVLAKKPGPGPKSRSYVFLVLLLSCTRLQSIVRDLKRTAAQHDSMKCSACSY